MEDGLRWGSQHFRSRPELSYPEATALRERSTRSLQKRAHLFHHGLDYSSLIQAERLDFSLSDRIEHPLRRVHPYRIFLAGSRRELQTRTEFHNMIKLPASLLPEKSPHLRVGKDQFHQRCPETAPLGMKSNNQRDDSLCRLLRFLHLGQLIVDFFPLGRKPSLVRGKKHLPFVAEVLVKRSGRVSRLFCDAV